MWGIDKTKGFGLGVINWWRCNKVCLNSLWSPKSYICGDKNAFFHSGPGWCLPRGRFISSFQADRIRASFFHQLFLKIFTFKSIYQTGIFGGGIFYFPSSYIHSMKLSHSQDNKHIHHPKISLCFFKFFLYAPPISSFRHSRFWSQCVHWLFLWINVE